MAARRGVPRTWSGSNSLSIDYARSTAITPNTEMRADIPGEPSRRISRCPWTLAWSWTPEQGIRSCSSSLRSCDISRSMAWWESRPDSTRRSLCTIANSSGDSSSSSLRVPEGFTSTAGKTRRSAILRSSLSSALPVPLNSSKMTVSPVDPVSTIAVAMMVSDPPSSMLRAAPRKRLGGYNAVESTPPDRIRPDAGDALL